MKPMRQSPSPDAGFTRLDLLSVLVLVGLSFLMLLPTFARTKTDSRTFRCLNNVHELTRAWRMYCDDSQDKLPFASEGFDSPSPEYAWVTGTMDFNPSNVSNWDITRDIHKSPLWRYCGTNAAVWRCPGDSSYVVVNGVVRPRVRSVAMNFFLGGFEGTYGGYPPLWKLYLKLNEIVPQSPSRLFVFLDMRQDSIDSGAFLTRMDGFSETSPASGAYGFYDLPGAYHDGAGTFAFADGHSETHRWMDRRTVPPLVNNGVISDSFDSPGNPDVAWLQQRTTRPK